MHSFPIHAVSCASHLPRIVHSWNIGKEWRLWSSSFCSFISLLLFYPFSVIFSTAPCSETPSIYVLPLMSETKFHTHLEL
jgi:hypothetical protein